MYFHSIHIFMKIKKQIKYGKYDQGIGSSMRYGQPILLLLGVFFDTHYFKIMFHFRT